MLRRVGERAATPYITPNVKNGGGSFMVLGAFANCKVGNLHQVWGELNQTGYHSILQHQAIPSGTRFVEQGFVLMQDNDPKRTSKLYQRYIKSKEKRHVLQMISWPAQSADLNTIELVCDEIDRKIRAKQPTSAAHLWQLLLESWAELFSVFLQSSVKECRESLKQW